MEEGRPIKPNKPLEKMSINEELGDIPTHFMKSGSSFFRPKKDLELLNKFKKRIIPESHRGHLLNMTCGLMLMKSKL